MAYPVYEDNGGIAGSGTASVDVPYPSTVNENDILIAQILDADDDTFQTPSGWNHLTTINVNAFATVGMFWKRATGSETGSETFTSNSDAGLLICGVMSRYSGCVTSGTPYDSWSQAGILQGSPATVPGLTTLGATRLVVNFLCIEDNVGFTQATSYTEIFDIDTTTGSDASLGAQTQQKATAGVVSAETSAIGGNDYWGSVTVSLRDSIPAGWTHKISGVAADNMASVNGVAKANISKINGV